MRLLEKSPNERYPSATALRERLESTLRSLTRDDPASLVRAELAEAGYLPAQRRPSSSAAIVAEARPSLSPLWRALAGQAAVLAAFAASVLAFEGGAVRDRATRDPSTEALSLVPKEGGGLRVVASPWAHVRVDGQDVDTTPFARAIPLPPGKHWVTLTHPDSPPVERDVVVEPGNVVTLDVTMPIDALKDGGKDAR